MTSKHVFAWVVLGYTALTLKELALVFLAVVGLHIAIHKYVETFKKHVTFKGSRPLLDTSYPARNSYFFWAGHRELFNLAKESSETTFRSALEYIIRAQALSAPIFRAAFHSVILNVLAFAVLICGLPMVIAVNAAIYVGFYAAFSLYCLALAATYVIDYAYIVLSGFSVSCTFLFCRHEAAFALPAYKCGHCGRPHDRLRPSLHGILRHRCVCDKMVLPSACFAGREALPSVCPKCGEPLGPDHLRARKYFIGVAGAPSSGKTAFIDAVVLELLASPSGAPFPGKPRFADGPRRPIGLVYDLPGRKTMLVFHEAPGEALTTRGDATALGFLGRATAILLLLDPLSFRGPREERLSGGAGRAGRDLPPPADAIASLLRMALENATGAAQGQKALVPLAVALTTTDVAGCPGSDLAPDRLEENRKRMSQLSARDADDAYVRDKIAHWGGDDVVRGIDGSFATVGFFACAPLSGIGGRCGAVRHNGVIEPLTWLLRSVS